MISKFFATSFEPQLKWGLHQIVEVAKDSNEMKCIEWFGFAKGLDNFWNKIQKLGNWLSRMMSFVEERSFFVEDVDFWLSASFIFCWNKSGGPGSHFLRMDLWNLNLMRFGSVRTDTLNHGQYEWMPFAVWDSFFVWRLIRLKNTKNPWWWNPWIPRFQFFESCILGQNWKNNMWAVWPALGG